MSLDSILNATSVAVIGASKNETKRGYQAIRILLEERYEGIIYPVNPRETMILGIPCYKSISDIKESVDMALITTPATTVPGILEECGECGVKGAVVIAGGFREVGEQGEDLENRIVETAAKYGIRVIGPNTSGMINIWTGLNLVGLRDTPKGNIALLTQSGNMALALITEAKLKSRQGFSYYVGVGNEADIKFHEYLEFFGDDPRTKAILIYVEGMRQGRRFLQHAYQVTLKKPVILLKGGRSDTGKQSAGSHTGALAGISEVASNAFKLAGITLIENSDELFPAAETLAEMPPIKNNSIAVLADGGGHATIAADLLTDMGINIPELDETTQEKLRQILPQGANVINPIDVAGGTDSDPAVFAACAEIILKDHNVGGLLLVGLFGGYGIRFAETLAFQEQDAAFLMGKMVKKRRKPVIVHSLYNSEKPHALKLLRYYGIPVYDSLDIACKCVSVLAEYGSFIHQYHAKARFVFNWKAKAKSRGNKLLEKVRKEGRVNLLENEAKELFRLHHADISNEILARTGDEAVKYAASIDGEVVLKISSPDILHKSDARGVKVGLKTEESVRAGFAEIMENARAYNPAADIRGVLVMPMAKPGVEVIIGTKIDDQFGPIIIFGIGGIMVEILKDFTTRVLPISERSARRMIDEIRSAPILNGVRGTVSSDKQAIKRLLLLCSEIIESYPDIREMDLNPVVVYEDGLSIVDARIILHDNPVG